MTALAQRYNERPCSVEGCDRNARYSSGWCHLHHRRWERNGSPAGIMTLRGAPMQFVKETLTSDTEECVIWPYSRARQGYAQITIGNKPQGVHRLICAYAAIQRLRQADPTIRDLLNRLDEIACELTSEIESIEPHMQLRSVRVIPIREAV